jgi:cytoskeletal protein CcmA (bactofilin family)
MLFQKASPKIALETVEESQEYISGVTQQPDEVETVVGPSVNVEGDFASEGNIVVKGTVTGSVRTSRYLLVEPGAKIVANVRAGSAKISGEVKGNIKVKDSLELTSTARVLGDIEVKILSVEPGALIFGKIIMPGMEGTEAKASRRTYRKNEAVEDMSATETE